MCFCLYLVQRGYISAEQAIEVYQVRADRREPIGRLALKHGLVTVHQVVEILQYQALEAPTKRFGDAAVALGFLETEDVLRLLKLQEQLTPLIDDVVVDIDALTFEEVEQARRQFRLAVMAA